MRRFVRRQRAGGSDNEALSYFNSVWRYYPLPKARLGCCVISKDLKRIQQRARELARSGRFFGARAVAFELSLSLATHTVCDGSAASRRKKS